MRGDPVRIFGPHGAVRDYIHVEDIASGIFALWKREQLDKRTILALDLDAATLMW